MKNRTVASLAAVAIIAVLWACGKSDGGGAPAAQSSVSTKAGSFSNTIATNLR
jgi:hypothetical protein